MQPSWWWWGLQWALTEHPVFMLGALTEHSVFMRDSWQHKINRMSPEHSIEKPGTFYHHLDNKLPTLLLLNGEDTIFFDFYFSASWHALLENIFLNCFHLCFFMMFVIHVINVENCENFFFHSLLLALLELGFYIISEFLYFLRFLDYRLKVIQKQVLDPNGQFI